MRTLLTTIFWVGMLPQIAIAQDYWFELGTDTTHLHYGVVDLAVDDDWFFDLVGNPNYRNMSSLSETLTADATGSQDQVTTTSGVASEFDSTGQQHASMATIHQANISTDDASGVLSDWARWTTEGDGTWTFHSNDGPHDVTISVTCAATSSPGVYQCNGGVSVLKNGGFVGGAAGGSGLFDPGPPVSDVFFATLNDGDQIRVTYQTYMDLIDSTMGRSGAAAATGTFEIQVGIAVD